jgi:hypothetical protein
MWHYLNDNLEACTYLPGQEAPSSQTSCWDTYPSALLSLIPTAVACSSPASATVSCPISPSGMTLPPLTALPGGDTSMSSAGASPARTSVTPGSVQALVAHARVYGQSSPVSLGKYDPATHSLRTSQGLLFEASTACLQTLPRWGWMRAGAVSGLMMSERPISASGFGYSLPTPTVEDAGRAGSAAGWDQWENHQQTSQWRLRNFVQKWPTPQATYDGATDEALAQRKQRAHEKHARGEYGKGTGAPGMFDLARAVRMWPTPNVPNGGRTTWHAEQEGNSYYHKGKKVQLGLEQEVRMNEPDGGQLSPTWVEWLMAWPIGWTDLRPWGTAGYPILPWPHGTSCTAAWNHN